VEGRAYAVRLSKEAGVTSKKSSGDYFDTFYETLEKRGPSTSQTAQQVPSFGVEASAEPTVGVVLRLLLASEPRSIPDIAQALGAQVQTIASMLTSMQASGLVAIEGPPYQESVTITDAGRGIAALA
jgi:hypothetical protein